jgi:hypothetical protein
VKGRKPTNEKREKKRMRSKGRRRLRLTWTIIPLLVLRIIVEFLI